MIRFHSFIWAVGALLFSTGTWAGVFDIPHFVLPGEFSLGLEPELTLGSGSGLAATAHFTEGLSDSWDISGLLGTGGGDRQFRTGANANLEIFPDASYQPGVGIAFQALYLRLPDMGSLELTGIPYIHKSFATASSVIDPFFAIPIGWSFAGGQYQMISTADIGAHFQASEHFRYVLEIGIPISNSASYISGGVIYSH